MPETGYGYLYGGVGETLFSAENDCSLAFRVAVVEKPNLETAPGDLS